MLHHPAALRAAFDRLGEDYITLARSLTDTDLDRPGLGEWNVRELLGHAVRAFNTVATYLDASMSSDFRMHTAGEYYRRGLSGPTIHADVAERGRQAGAALGRTAVEVAASIAGTIAAACARVGDADDDADVNTSFGIIRLMPYLQSRIVEGGVHLLDLHRALDRPFVLDGATAEIIMATLAGAGDATQIILALTGRGALPAGFNVLGGS